MSALAVLLVLIGSVAHATWNLLVARVPDGGPIFVWVYSALSLALCVPVAVVVSLTADEPVSPTWLWAGAMSALLHTVYAVLLQWGYARTDMNTTYPVARGFGPVIVAAFAATFMGDRFGDRAVVGIAVIVLGVLVISSGADKQAGPSHTAAGSRWLSSLPSIGIGVVVGVTIAGYTLWDAFSVNVLSLPPIQYYVVGVLVQFLVLCVVNVGKAAQAIDVLREHGRTATGVAVRVPVSYLLVLLAITMAPVALVAALRCTSIVFGSIAAWWLLKEKHGTRRLAGAGLVLIGAVALSTASG